MLLTVIRKLISNTKTTIKDNKKQNKSIKKTKRHINQQTFSLRSQKRLR